MNSKNLKIGETYRHRGSPGNGFAKVVKILPPKTGINTNTYAVAECEWTTHQDSCVGLIKYFHPRDLVKIK